MSLEGFLEIDMSLEEPRWLSSDERSEERIETKRRQSDLQLQGDCFAPLAMTEENELWNLASYS